MAKMTLLKDVPNGHLLLEGVEGEGPFFLAKDVETEVHAKRAVSYLGDDTFKVVLSEEELDSLDEGSLAFGATLLGLEDGSKLKGKLLSKKKKSTVQKVTETVKAVTSSVTPTTTNDQSSDEADSADESE
tara:strand:- start:108 stop:497 length:390 start_codon:yes stop_codon:yes gene_type:complete